jgi:hypothetical protein
MRHRPPVAILLLLAAGCHAEEPAREPTTFADDALSMVAPEGWRVKHEKDTLVFVGGSSDEDRQAVIAVRAVPSGDWSEPRTSENLLPSVKTVLEALPGAKVVGPREIEHPVYRAYAFDVVRGASTVRATSAVTSSSRRTSTSTTCS